MKPVVYIHIGQHRTGTTSLQNFLATNRGVLYKKGFIYPEFLKPASSHFFAWYFGFGNRRLSSSEDKQVEGVLQKTIRDALEQSKDVLISSEILFSNIRKSSIKRIHKQFSDFDIRIICYLRRQDKYILSFYTQYLKHGNTRDVDAYIKRQMFRWYHALHKPAYNWYKKLKKYASVFGKENIVIRPYEKKWLIAGNAVADFMNILGIDGLIIPAETENASLPEEGIQLLRSLNYLRPEGTAKIGEGERAVSYAGILEQYYKGQKIQQKITISPECRRAIMKKFDRGNRKIAKVFLGRKDGILFSDPLQDEQNGLPESVELDGADIIRKLTAILVSQHQQIKYLNQKFRKSK